MLRVDEKYRLSIRFLNVCGVIITTNDKTDGIHLPADDRRHFVAWSDLKDDFGETTGAVWGWYARRDRATSSLTSRTST